MKPSALRIERLLAKVEAESRARPRRYCFHFDEVAEAEAQGLPYVLVPRVLSREEWEKKYSGHSAGDGTRLSGHRRLFTGEAGSVPNGAIAYRWEVRIFNWHIQKSLGSRSYEPL
jgi:hypothetical protein